MNTTIDLTTRLETLRDEYTYRLNLLLDEGREDLAAKLSDEYVDEAPGCWRPAPPGSQRVQRNWRRLASS